MSLNQILHHSKGLDQKYNFYQIFTNFVKSYGYLIEILECHKHSPNMVNQVILDARFENL